jgi:ATP-dependent DNA helicase RecG
MTTLSRISPHRLRALVLEELKRYPDSSSSEINRRIGVEISPRTLRRALEALVSEETVTYTGDRRWRRYRLGGQAGA